jgi:serine/threonine protein phosphatase 1
MPSTFAIGDIHGEFSQLSALLNALPRTDADTTVFIGDYIDRGPDSAGVVTRVLAEHDAAPDRTILLWGNHEDMAANHFGFDTPSKLTLDPYDWFKNGGYEALASYGVKTPAEAFTAPCPPELTKLFGLLKLFWRDPSDNTIYVHAGVLPYQIPEKSDPATLLWVRGEFLYAPIVPDRLVVFGHTPQKNGLPLLHADKIGIDTAAVFGGPLTAIQLPERTAYQALKDGTVRAFDF